MTNTDSDNSREWAAQAYALLKKRQEEQKQQSQKQEEQKQELQKMDKFEIFKTGSVQSSYGGQYSYKVIGPCCRLYDREELPWPCSCLLYTSPSPRDYAASRMPSSA